MNPTSETKTIESTPISTIKEELREALIRTPNLEFKTDEDGSTLVDWHFEWDIPHPITILEFDDVYAEKMVKALVKNVPALLESHDMLEAAMRWVPVSEILPKIVDEMVSDGYSDFKQSALLEMFFEFDEVGHGYYCEDSDGGFRWYCTDHYEVVKPLFWRIFIGPEVTT